MVDMVESWTVIKRLSVAVIECQCKICGRIFLANGCDLENVKLTWHPKSNSWCNMPQCPNDCEQIMK